MEIVFLLLIGQEETIKRLLNEAIEEVNEELKLNVTLGISIDFGVNYAAVH